ncbi:hypothetical protein DICVIV_05490 [Dictyocaulus viviparus]|uniref:Uncharacterized protein n=1 Tax=Dictyocaulus viviparus TaxID=29172 RepID=A0A0D8XV38_DICVI|nr:hypothetical protein DICVIV_05490 [Dictyocaulus viviparus]
MKIRKDQLNDYRMNNSTSCHRVYSPVDKVAHSHDGYNSCSFYDSSQSYMKERTCFSWLKYGIFTASIVFIVVGGLLLAIGIWLRSDSRFRGFLSER